MIKGSCFGVTYVYLEELRKILRIQLTIKWYAGNV